MLYLLLPQTTHHSENLPSGLSLPASASPPLSLLQPREPLSVLGPSKHRLPLHQHGSCRSFLLSDRTHASRQLLFQWGLAYEQGILFSEFLVKIFHLIKFLQPALLCVCQKVEARAALSSAPWEAGSRSLWGEPSPRWGLGRRGGGEPCP